MASSGPNRIFNKYKGQTVKGVGYFSDTEKTGWISIYCAKNDAINRNPDIGAGMIYLDVGDENEAKFISLGLKQGDKIYFRGEAKRWKWKKYIDTKKSYIRIEVDYIVLTRK